MKKLFVIIFAIFLVLLLIQIAFAQNDTSSQTASRSCTDSDKGSDPYTKGIGRGLLHPGGGMQGEIDVCEKDYTQRGDPLSTILREAFCTRQDFLAVETIKCPYGCEKGACLKTRKCIDSDGGLNFDIKGFTISSSASNDPSAPIPSKLLRSEDACEKDFIGGGSKPYKPNSKRLLELYCKGGYSLSEFHECKHGCEDGACLDKSGKSKSLCREVIPNHNNPAEKRVNIVFVGINYSKPDAYRYLVDESVNFRGDFYGLLSFEPFKSNKDKFNFWYVDKIAGIPSQSFLLPELIYNLSSNCVLTNKYPIGLVNYGFRSYATSGGMTAINAHEKSGFDTPQPVSCLIYDTDMNGCINNSDLTNWMNRGLQVTNDMLDCISIQAGCFYGRTPTDKRQFASIDISSKVVHEFGHLFGWLLDEYVQKGRSPLKIKYKLSNCFEGSKSESLVLTNNWWANLLGFGCGNDVVIDCKSGDKFYNLEVQSYEGCNFQSTGYQRPSFETIMRGSSEPLSFGPVNEKLLCLELKNVVGNVGGYCTTEFGIS